MAVRKVDFSVPDSRKNVTMRNDPSRIDPRKLKLGRQNTQALRFRSSLSALGSLLIARRP